MDRVEIERKEREGCDGKTQMGGGGWMERDREEIGYR